jgi:GntR family transcriptional regulator, phosphonate transport system regulatory protein
MKNSNEPIAIVTPGVTPPIPKQSLWFNIEQSLAADIAEGAFAPGARLPSEHALAERLGVNRHTVRQAISSLAAKGLVEVAHGSGSYVTEFAVDLILGKRARHSQNLAASGLTGALRVVQGATIDAPSDISAALELRIGAKVLLLHTLGDAEGRPICYGQRFFPAKRFPNLQSIVEETGSITKAFATYGVNDYTRRQSAITAQIPEPDVARHLVQSCRRPVMYVESVNVDDANKPIEYARMCFAGDRVKLIYTP